ncbi:response regulator transcription factor [bacterium]|nr:response regulator transcription factor [bacterium]
MKLLLVEDEENTVGFLQRGLREEGFVVDVARTAREADLAVHDQDYDAILLDVMLPGEDGFSLCRRWRARGLNLPVLFVTARDALPDRVEGLNLGADDYLVKPFAFEELLARLHARLRRREGTARNEPLRAGPLELDLAARQARLHGNLLDLTSREFLILELLVTHANQVVSRAQLWEQAWETGSEPSSNVVDVYVGYVRHKLGEGRGLIQTVRGLGYRFSVPEA